MLTLGIDTAGRRAGVALLENDRVLVTRSAVGKHSSLLLPMISEMLESQNRGPLDLALVGVASGPGTYTGLRVGVVTAKLLGRSTPAMVLGVPTLEAMARHAPAEADRVLVALHAYKKRMLLASYERSKKQLGDLALCGNPELKPAEEVRQQLKSETEGAQLKFLITDAPELLGDLDELDIAVPSFDTSAVTVAQLAWNRISQGHSDETETLAPVYLRPPSITVKKETAR